MSTGQFQFWTRILAPCRNDIRSVLEIGSFEGVSANYFLRELPRAKITCIDTFAGSPEHREPDSSVFHSLPQMESRFDANTARFGDRVEKLKSRSVPALDMLTEQQRRFDLIYIDGSHQRDDVLADSVLCWRLLNVGGILIWDDWAWNLDWPREKIPRDAIDFFVNAFGPGLQVLEANYQLIARKTAGWPGPVGPDKK